LRITNITKGIEDVNGKRTDNTIAKRKTTKDKQWSTKHWIEN